MFKSKVWTKFLTNQWTDMQNFLSKFVFFIEHQEKKQLFYRYDGGDVTRDSTVVEPWILVILFMSRVE